MSLELAKGEPYEVKGNRVPRGSHHPRLGDQGVGNAMVVRVTKGGYEGHQRGKQDYESSQGVLGEHWAH